MRRHAAECGRSRVNAAKVSAIAAIRPNTLIVLATQAKRVTRAVQPLVMLRPPVKTSTCIFGVYLRITTLNMA